MADLHHIFLQYSINLVVPDYKMKRLKSAENAVKEQLEKYFLTQPKYNFHHFKLQGSKSVGTLIHKDESIDVDLGIYFYPNPEVEAKTLMEHIHKALSNLSTHKYPVRKNKCIRVIYNEKQKFHIDVPAFFIEKISGDKNPHLATRNGWVKSNVSEFEKWVRKEIKENLQLKEIIRYLKGWANNQVNEMPNGLVMTVLATKCQSKDDRDDIAFLATLKNIRKFLYKDFRCIMPAVPNDDLLEKFSKKSTLKDEFLKSLDGIILDGTKALKVKNTELAIELWKKHLGKKFNKL